MPQRFTLVELMIVVAIIGILAAIAIPSFHQMQLKAKQAEMPACVDGIITAWISYSAANDAMTPAGTGYPVPGATPDKTLRDFVGAGTVFASIGWSPDGQVRGVYGLDVAGSQIATSGCSGSNTAVICNVPTSSQRCAAGTMDLDGDTLYSAFMIDEGEGVSLPLESGCF